MNVLAIEWSWSEILWVSLIGFCLVVVMLLLLVGIMKIGGADDYEYQAGLLALELENSRINPDARQKITFRKQ